MAYVDFKGLRQYGEKHSGAALEVLLYDENDPGEPIIGAAASLSLNEQFGKSPVEEVGNDGVDEFVDDRHTGQGSMQAFWTPEWADQVLTRTDFIGKKYTLVVRIGKKRAGAGTVTDVCTGTVINSINYQHGGRGPRTMDIGILFSTRYSGQEWADLAGT